MRWSVYLATMPVANRDRFLDDVREAVVVALEGTQMENVTLHLSADDVAPTLRLAASVDAADPAAAFDAVSREFTEACTTAGLSSHPRWEAVLVLPELISDRGPDGGQ